MVAITTTVIIETIAEIITVTVKTEELLSLDAKAPGPLPNWRTVTELSLGPSGEIMREGAKVPVQAKAWKGPREIQPPLGRRKLSERRGGGGRRFPRRPDRGPLGHHRGFQQAVIEPGQRRFRAHRNAHVLRAHHRQRRQIGRADRAFRS